MKIRNRLPDIKQQLTHLLQSFFKIEILRLNHDADWKSSLWGFIERGMNSQYQASYVGAYQKIGQIGLENYTVDDMDDTILFAILGDWDRSTVNRRSKQVNLALDTLKSDRNKYGHLTGNEPDSEMRVLAYGLLHDIRRFTAAISAESQYQPLGAQEFAANHDALLNDFQQMLDNDFAEEVRYDESLNGMRRDIADIKNSKDPLSAWHRTLMDKYFNTAYFLDGTYQRFLQTAAEAGISWAKSHLADFYFEGMTSFGVEPDYEKAAVCYQQLHTQNSLNAQQLLNLASIYLNGLAAGHTSDDGKMLLEKCTSKYSSYTVGEYTFYRFQPSKARGF